MRAHVLLYYSTPARGAELLQRLTRSSFEVTARPATRLSDAWAEGSGIDLVLLDPPEEDESWLSACEELRGHIQQPIVVLSSRDDELHVVRTLAAGVDDYIVEPVGDRELRARLEALLRRARRSTADPQGQQIGALRLLPEALAVEIRGRRIPLSPIEFRLLGCLVAAPGTVLTHQTLMARVWGAEYVGARHYLRVYIRYLRQKLEEDPAHPRLIVSEWGIGYRLDPTAAAPSTPNPR